MRAIRTGILAVALGSATFALAASALADRGAIPGATYRDRPKGDVKSVEITTSSNGKRIEYFDVRFKDPCHPGFTPSLALRDLKIKAGGEFKGRESEPLPGGSVVIKARGAFSRDGRRARGRWSFSDTSGNDVCRARTRFDARTNAKSEDGEGADDGPPLGRWSGTTAESLPIEFRLERSAGSLRLADVAFRTNVVCEDAEGNQSTAVYDGQIASGHFETENSFDASDSTDGVRVIGELEGRVATGRITVEDAPVGATTCSTPDPSGIAFTAQPD
jgi:hypothetical protein